MEMEQGKGKRISTGKYGTSDRQILKTLGWAVIGQALDDYILYHDQIDKARQLLTELQAQYETTKSKTCKRDIQLIEHHIANLRYIGDDAIAFLSGASESHRSILTFWLNCADSDMNALEFTTMFKKFGQKWVKSIKSLKEDNNLDPEILQGVIDTAKKSSSDEKIGVVIYKGKKVLASVGNLSRNSKSPVVIALKKASTTKSMNAVVIKLNSRGELKYAKPEEADLKALAFAGIRNIMWSTGENTEKFESTRLYKWMFQK